ncbi:Dehydrogenase/reductase SDR family member on chromosome X [Orchesella cincta]|uniref:Dehydrogenase/reductase SDR family member on chromosome X n=1 Tax=Orchesella cincta TaxID=48709 RepID=A0A1D2MHP3_ORCCI|nr:Dehydrogenase/reductase SDR family member on chromosome X [Orchesella cincta]
MTFSSLKNYGTMESTAVNNDSSNNIGPGKGFLNLLKRIWYHLLVLFIGGKWSLIETFTRHRKLQDDETHQRVRAETAVITGGARGIGAEVVRQCLQLNMHVIIGCRKPSAGETLIQKLRDEGVSSGTAEALPLDLNSLNSVRDFAQCILNKNVPVHYLLNNAGVMFHPFQLTTDGIEAQFQTNYLSHFLLTNLLLPALNQGGQSDKPSRVINVSSAAQYGGQLDFNNIDMKHEHSPHMAYMSSKLMQVISTVDLNRRFQEKKMNVRIYALHPGVVRTDLYEHVCWVNFFGRLLNVMFKTPEQGADGIMFVAVSQNVSADGGTFYANCTQQAVNPLAFNRDVQDRLYNISTDLCQLNSSETTASKSCSENITLELNK